MAGAAGEADGAKPEEIDREDYTDGSRAEGSLADGDPAADPAGGGSLPSERSTGGNGGASGAPSAGPSGNGSVAGGARGSIVAGDAVDWAAQRAGLRPPGAGATAAELGAYLHALKADCADLARANGREKAAQYVARARPQGGQEDLAGALADVCEGIGAAVVELDVRKQEVEQLWREVTRLRLQRVRGEEALREKVGECEGIMAGNDVEEARQMHEDDLYAAAMDPCATEEARSSGVAHFLHALRMRVYGTGTPPASPPLPPLTPAQAAAVQRWLRTPTPRSLMVCGDCRGALDTLSRPRPAAAAQNVFHQHSAANEYWHAPTHMHRVYRGRTPGVAHLPRS
eukprot:TRINITY_DN25051_c0_g1_i1.p1 TRINITY_DN25051_c0_g1~~TRINITY_DN25051_c0_g1_i1.p1  ORF type:complete len:362 (+),score=98.49 TRINITY_DN25051_c0_g1_i1:58-1086(+)